MRLVLSVLAVVHIFLCSASAADSQIKKGKAQTSPTNLVYSTAPFDSTVKKLPLNYGGNSLPNVLQTLRPPAKKGEFETTADYEARIEGWKKMRFLKALRPEDVFAFRFYIQGSDNSLLVGYDADMDELSATFRMNKTYFEGNSSNDGYWLETDYVEKNLGSRPALTRMGVKFRVTSHKATSLGLMMQEELRPIRVVAKVPRAIAPTVKDNIRVFAVVTLAAPYNLHEVQTKTASLDSPQEGVTSFVGLHAKLLAVLMVDGLSGEILARADAPFD